MTAPQPDPDQPGRDPGHDKHEATFERARQRADAAIERARQRAGAGQARAQARVQASGSIRSAAPAVRRRGRSGSTSRLDGHDYRDCYEASKEHDGLAAQDCGRFPCRVYREGRDHGFHDGYADGYRNGFVKGYALGLATGLARTGAGDQP